jgi:hypothetical protein
MLTKVRQCTWQYCSIQMKYGLGSHGLLESAMTTARARMLRGPLPPMCRPLPWLVPVGLWLPNQIASMLAQRSLGREKRSSALAVGYIAHAPLSNGCARLKCQHRTEPCRSRTSFSTAFRVTAGHTRVAACQRAWLHNCRTLTRTLGVASCSSTSTHTKASTLSFLLCSSSLATAQTRHL